MEIIIPEYAKQAAKKGLKDRSRLPNYKKFGLDENQASKLGIASGVYRAKQIIRNKTMPIEDAKKVARFYSRFKNCRTPKCVGALNIWGGAKWGKVVYNKIYGNKNKT